MPPNPPNKAHGFAMRSISLRDMQISKSEKKNSCPPPPCQILGTPLNSIFRVISTEMQYVDTLFQSLTTTCV